ncbi:MAG TPA: F0F1 ATP synthase subunit A [Dehalococcoidia bacterium]|nr:F0F1 ATP synthase subunit A [Dehalococcoidia bacterium]
MKNPRTILIAVGALVLLAVGFLFFRSPKPIIEIKAEKLADIGPFPLVNTYVSSTLTLIVLVIVAWMLSRRISLIPGGLQNVVEAAVEAFYNICVQAAGEKNARRFFPVVMTILVFIWVANWMALLPFFNAIGTVEKVNAEEFHKEAVVMSKTAGITLISPNKKAIEFDVDEAPCNPFDRGPAKDKARHDTCIEGQRALAIIEQLEKKEHVTVPGAGTCAGSPGDHERTACLVGYADEAIDHLHQDNKELGIVKPYFRSMNTDINSPLSIAIMAMIFVEFWGITALGFFKYAGKFINFSSPINMFVGVLELIAEIARLISFTFRLFGNMLAGEILLLVMTFLLPFLVALPFYGLEVFVGFIQAFVFAMLTLVFAVLAVSTHEEHGEHEPVEVTALH